MLNENTVKGKEKAMNEMEKEKKELKEKAMYLAETIIAEVGEDMITPEESLININLVTFKDTLSLIQIFKMNLLKKLSIHMIKTFKKEDTEKKSYGEFYENMLNRIDAVSARWEAENYACFLDASAGDVRELAYLLERIPEEDIMLLIGLRSQYESIVAEKTIRAILFNDDISDNILYDEVSNAQDDFIPFTISLKEACETFKDNMGELKEDSELEKFWQSLLEDEKNNPFKFSNLVENFFNNKEEK